jgi:hypothetical protein
VTGTEVFVPRGCKTQRASQLPANTSSLPGDRWILVQGKRGGDRAAVASKVQESRAGARAKFSEHHREHHSGSISEHHQRASASISEHQGEHQRASPH